MLTPMGGETVRGGRIESSAPVRQVSPGNTTPLMPADPNRVAALFSAVFPGGATVDTAVLIGSTISGQFISYVVLSPASPTFLLRYADVGDLIYQAWSAIDATAGGAIVTGVSFRWHPENESCGQSRR